jgi:type II secretory pathway pseudopilin PulG
VTRSTSEGGYTLLEVLLVAGLIGVISAIAIPMTANSLRSFRISGDARSISGMIALAKLRAASAFSRARVHIDLDAKGYRLETQKSAGAPWVAEGGMTHLSTGVTLWDDDVPFSAPPTAVDPIAQAPPCLDAADTPIVNTACVVFNSRGIPIDPATSTPTGAGAVYVTDGMVLHGITISATGLTQVWQSLSSAALWVKQ